MLQVVSLFSGCGGLDLGFLRTGFEIIYACDSDPVAVDCYIRNVDPRAVVRDVTSDKFHDEVEGLGRCDVVLGGFPCQGFSKAGPKRSGDPRNALYVEMKRAVEKLRPAIFLAENVDGLRQNYGGAYIDRITSDFAAIGYDVEHRILDAAAYGVPQFRRRIFFVGCRAGSGVEFRWPQPTHHAPSRNGEFKVGSGAGPTLWDDADTRRTILPRPATIADTIPDLLELDPAMPDHRTTGTWPASYQYIFRAIGEGQKLCNVRHAATSVYTWQIPDVFGETSDDERRVLETISRNRRHRRYGTVPNGNPLSTAIVSRLCGIANVEPVIASLLEKRYLKHVDGKYDLLGAMFCSGLFKRPHWDAPSPTVLTVFDNPRYFLHPLQNRPFSVRECARLQGFPDAFRFGTTAKPHDVRNAYRLIGNAVPPPLAERFARSFWSFLEQADPDDVPMKRRRNEAPAGTPA